MEHFGEILKAFRTEVLKVSLETLSAMLKKESQSLRISDSTLGGYERKERPKQKHGSAELYRVFKERFGVDLSQWQTDESIVVDDLTKLTPDNVQQLKKLGAHFRNIPLFEHIPPFKGNEKYPEPRFSVRSELCQTAEFGILAIDNSMAPVINKEDYVFCRELLADENIKQGHLYLVSFDNRSGRTFRIGSVEKKGNEIVLVQAKPGSKPVVIPENTVRGIYKVVGHYRGEAGINH